MVGLLSVRKIVQPQAACVLQGDAREAAATILPLSVVSHRFVYIIVAYCPIGKSTESGIPCLSSAEDIEWLRQKSCGNVPHRTV
jgi:hypothetical protein